MLWQQRNIFCCFQTNETILFHLRRSFSSKWFWIFNLSSVFLRSCERHNLCNLSKPSQNFSKYRGLKAKLLTMCWFHFEPCFFLHFRVISNFVRIFPNMCPNPQMKIIMIWTRVKDIFCGLNHKSETEVL